jgi:hypothetical protein
VRLEGVQGWRHDEVAGGARGVAGVKEGGGGATARGGG